MNATEFLSHGLHSYFENFLLVQRNMSGLTILAYRDAIKLFLQFVAMQKKIPVPDLSMKHFDVDTVLAFLDYLENSRGVAVQTRNHRLAVLHSLFRFFAGLDPRYFHQCQRILQIPFKRCESKAVTYLTKEEMAHLLDQPDQTTETGQRDFILLSLMYNTGCRVQEMLLLRACDISLERPYQVRFFGKGRKERVCPLWPQTAIVIKKWLTQRTISPVSENRLFLNKRGQPITRFGVNYLFNVYQKSIPALQGKKLHPHLLRHTTAVHLLQAGVELNMIRNILGHASVATTNRYAEVDFDMKRQALESAIPTFNQGKQRLIWNNNKDLLHWLESL